MGAVCTGAKAVDIDNSVKDKLAKEAKEWIKNMENGEASFDDNRLSSSFKKKRRVDEQDPQQNMGLQGQQKGSRKHETLWQAVETNNMKAAENFLNANEVDELSMYDSAGQTMIHKAAALGFAEMLILLLERTGAKPDLVNAQLTTPLHLACRSNRDNIAKFLIGCGVEANVQDENGQTPLLVSTIHGHTAMASLLLESSISGLLPEPIEADVKDHRGLTPLNCAAIKGELQLVQLLVQRGGANCNQNSPKGCTPLMYASRGGYSEVVRFLLNHKASPIKQDSSGGTVFHHAVEKGHHEVLEVMLECGVDVYSAIEIADNAGRTPLFEAIESTFDLQDDQEVKRKQTEMVKILTRRKQLNGYAAKVNVVNYSGQTPLYSAARSGNLEVVRLLVEAGAHVDLNSGELVKQNEQEDDSYESQFERYFMEAFMNTMTPLQIATVLGFDEIALYLIDRGADPNLRSNVKGYTPLHMAVLANKPEMLIELLTKTNASATIEDSSGRTLIDMVNQYIPSYADSFQLLLEHLQRPSEQLVQDDRKIEGMSQLQGIQADNQQYVEMFAQKIDQTPELAADQKNLVFSAIEESDIQTEDEVLIDRLVESIFGRKAALCLVSVEWKHKESVLKHIIRQSEKQLVKSDAIDMVAFVKALVSVVSLTCQEKVIKVLNLSLQLFSNTVQAQRVEQDPTLASALKEAIVECHIVARLLQKSEESNTIVTKKIHETLLDLSYVPQIGEDLVAGILLKQIAQHYAHKVINPKGLMVQMALLYKMVASFGLCVSVDLMSIDDLTRGQALTVDAVLSVAVQAVALSNQDVKNAAIKVILEVQKLTGAVKESHLSALPEKTKDMLLEKLSQVEFDGEANSKIKQGQKSVMQEVQSKEVISQMQAAVVNIGESDELTLSSQALKREIFLKNKAILSNKAASRDKQEKEEALAAIPDCFENSVASEITGDQKLIAECTSLLLESLETNNMQVYITALQAASVFLEKTISCEIVQDSLQNMIRSIVLRSADTNTRVRKKSVELINQLWSVDSTKLKSTDEKQISTIIAGVLTDPVLQEKAIVGRLGLFIKRAIAIESSEDLSKTAHHLILGKDYEQLTEFASSWCLHKNTKVRQCALKLIVEICRVNHIDPKGQPFKQRIINYILALRPSLRDPLVAKINEVCALEQQIGLSNMEAPRKKAKHEPFINLNQQEISIAANTRAASLDVRRGIKQSGQVSRHSTLGSSNLPQIQGSLPVIASNAAPTIVLPHSEPLTDAQKKQAEPFLEIFGLEIITCLLSHNWASRQAAMQKVEEQLHNFDPKRRDAMYGEINRTNQPPEVSYKVFLLFAEESIKDVNLNNYLMILQLVQKALPIYFRYLQPMHVKRDLMPVVSLVLKKCGDMKAKVREASINFCLHLSHQSPVGPQSMVEQIFQELSAPLPGQSSLSNTNFVQSCLHLLNQLQQQSNIADSMFDQYMTQVNVALKHQNPQVKKQGETLFKTLFSQYGEKVVKGLEDQKPQLVAKIVAEAKQEIQTLAEDCLAGEGFSALIGKQSSEEDSSKQQLVRVQERLREESLNSSTIQALLGNELINQLKLPNSAKRVKAIVDIKKVVQSKLTKITSQTAGTLLEPLSQLSNVLLKDNDADVYMEALNFLKFMVGGLAPHLSAFEMHLLIGTSVSALVNNNAGENVRAQLASNKVIIFCAKHTSIGSFVVAKEVVKLIERNNKSDGDDKHDILIRLYGILQMLLQQFSIVLCYQPAFYQQMLEQIADTLIKRADVQVLKSACIAFVISLHQIDSKQLDAGIGKLDLTRKTPLKKIMIEFDNVAKKGTQVNLNKNDDSQMESQRTSQKTQPLIAGQSRNGSPETQMVETLNSFKMSDTQGSSIYSRRFREMDQTLNSPNQQTWNERARNSEVRLSRRSEILTPQNTTPAIGRLTVQRDELLGTRQDFSRNEQFLPDIGNNRRTIQTLNVAPVEKVKRVGAGFKRDSETNNFTGLNNTAVVNQGPITLTAGIGKLQNNEVVESPLYKPSDRKQRPLGESETKPPLYVPSRRTPAVQPEVKSNIFQTSEIRAKNPSTDASMRYQPSQLQQPKQAAKLPAPTSAVFTIRNNVSYSEERKGI